MTFVQRNKFVENKQKMLIIEVLVLLFLYEKYETHHHNLFAKLI